MRFSFMFDMRSRPCSRRLTLHLIIWLLEPLPLIMKFLILPHKDALDPWLPTECPAKTNQTAWIHRLICLRWAHMQSCRVCCAPTQIIYCIIYVENNDQCSIFQVNLHIRTSILLLLLLLLLLIIIIIIIININYNNDSLKPPWCSSVSILTMVLQNPVMPFLCKQCRFISVGLKKPIALDLHCL